ncbi:MAG: tRNA pseudouridine(38-40) synthase TruA [Calditrichaeota bacterium]|nr:tRNA pseudouridine(38-40) synthase TruA [Calditrichota bacterium]
MNDRVVSDDRRRLKLIIEYDGSAFHGWQRQPDVRTVQEDIERALSSILQSEITVIGAGRTDAGVHALGQVVHFSTGNQLDKENILSGTNSFLQDDVRILSVEEVTPDFHARRSAVNRSYMYRLSRELHPLERSYTWCPDCDWDDDLIKTAAESLVGSHSFMSFSHARPGEDEYICHVTQADWISDKNGADFRISANRFMHKMVRGIVGALIDVGRGNISWDEFNKLLNKPERNGATRVAKPQGLTLVEVVY